LSTLFYKNNISAFLPPFAGGSDTFSVSPVSKAQITRTQEKLMDINDLFDGIAEAFRQYQAEMAEQAQA
jgi:hypothetical protein